MKILGIFIFLLIVNYGFSKKVIKEIELVEFEITDSSLINVIDSFINNEKVCEYFSKDLTLNIDICNLNGKIGEGCSDSDSLTIMISSITDEDLLYSGAIGFINFKGHIITIFHVATNKLFKPLPNKRKFKYEVSMEINDKVQDVVYLIDDDSYTYFIYIFVNGRIILESKMPHCPTRRNIDK